MDKELAKQATSIPVIDRLIQLLDSIADSDESVSLKYLVDRTHLHPSTAFRILASLADHDMIERTASGKYRLGIKLLQLGSRVQGGLDLRREARDIIDWLRDQINETVNLVVREGDEVVYLDRAVPHRMMRVEQTIGGHAPLHVTAAGKLFLADGGAEACLEYAERTGLPARTDYSITDPTGLWRSVKTALQQGYALDDQEAELGVGCIGVPVRDSSGQVIAGISVSAPFERRKLDWIATIREAGNRLSSRLGFRSDAD